MPAWYEGVNAAVDLETTGIDPLDDRIVQAAFVFVELDGTIGAKSWIDIINPGVEIPVAASDIHGITTEIARARGIQPADALGQIAGLLDEITECAIPLVIYNAPFDWPLLIAEARRHGVAMPRVPIIDPLVCDRAMDRYRRGSRKLEDVARHYDYALEHAHYAKADAVAAVAIAPHGRQPLCRRRRAYSCPAAATASGMVRGVGPHPQRVSGRANRLGMAAP